MPHKDPVARRAWKKKYYHANKARIAAEHANYRIRKRVQITERRAAHWKKWAYGIDSATYAAMLEAQNGVCAICLSPETHTYKGTVLPLHVDHDHDTDKVRSLLCSACNSALGWVRDNANILRRAADYLDRHGSQPKPIKSRRPSVAPKTERTFFDFVVKSEFVGCGWDG